MLPNMRVQRTRSSASPPHSPLTRWPLGDPKRHRLGLALQGLALGCILTACASSSTRFQNLVVWNQTDKPERISITVDGSEVYSGVLGTIDWFPKIVRTQSMAWPAGQHTIAVTVPGRGITRSTTFVVSDKPVNLHVMVNLEEVEVGVTYGPEAYL